MSSPLYPTDEEPSEFFCIMAVCWYCSASRASRARFFLTLNNNAAIRIERTITPATTPAIKPVWLELEDPEPSCDSDPDGTAADVVAGSMLAELLDTVVLSNRVAVELVVEVGTVVFFVVFAVVFVGFAVLPFPGSLVVAAAATAGPCPETRLGDIRVRCQGMVCKGGGMVCR